MTAPARAAVPTVPTVAAVEAWVVDHLRGCQEPGALGLEDIAHVDPHPDGLLVACEVVVREQPMTPTRRRVALVDLDGCGVTLLDLGDQDVTRPAWSPDGARLAVVRTSDDGADAVVLSGAPPALEVAAVSDLPGVVESASWSPDGSRLALQVAMPGAEISDVHGSGTIGGPGDEAWRPRVLPAEGAGRRLAHVWDPHTGHSRVVSELTVWELAWSGDRALLAAHHRPTRGERLVRRGAHPRRPGSGRARDAARAG